MRDEDPSIEWERGKCPGVSSGPRERGGHGRRRGIVWPCASIDRIIVFLYPLEYPIWEPFHFSFRFFVRIRRDGRDRGENEWRVTSRRENELIVNWMEVNLGERVSQRGRVWSNLSSPMSMGRHRIEWNRLLSPIPHSQFTVSPNRGTHVLEKRHYRITQEVSHLKIRVEREMKSSEWMSLFYRSTLTKLNSVVTSNYLPNTLTLLFLYPSIPHSCQP